jgi:2-polyprenyl-3-methyl-5-hydroxy-6-metoxy-1,4-benzoquinol methylase
MTIGTDRRKAIRELTMKYSGSGCRILDIGSADGRCSRWIEHASVTTVDLDSRADIRWDLEKGLPGSLKADSYDLVIAGDVIEHIYNTHILMPAIHHVLKPGGKLIITAPNICQWKYRLAFMLGRIPSHAAEGDRTHPRRGHIRDYSYREMRNLLLKHNFSILEEKGAKPFLPRTLGHTVIMVGEKA